MITSPSYTNLPDPTTVPTVGVFHRVLAYLIDQFCTQVLVFPVYYFMVVRPNFTLVVLLWLLQFLYKPLLESRFGATLGKLALRLRVVDRGSYRRIGLNQSFVRYVPFAVAQFATLFLLIRISGDAALAEVESVNEYVRFLTFHPLSQSFVVGLCNNIPVFSSAWMVMDPWNRSLHDRWAQTFVVRKPEGSDLKPPSA